MELITQIKEFLEKYANLSPNFDPEYDQEDERFTGPDPTELLYVSLLLEKGLPIKHYPHSTYGSGCYKSDPEGEKLHSEILKQITSIIIKNCNSVI